MSDYGFSSQAIQLAAFVQGLRLFQLFEAERCAGARETITKKRWGKFNEHEHSCLKLPQ